MSDEAVFRHDHDSVRVGGKVTLACLGALPAQLDSVQGTITRVDLRDVHRIDTIGAWIIHRFARRHGATVEGLSTENQELFDQVARSDLPIPQRGPARPGWQRGLAALGRSIVLLGKTFVEMLEFLGATMLAIRNVLRHPRRFRFNAIVHVFDTAGVMAHGIIALMNFLIGFIIAQQGAVQLRQFGAEAFTINLAGRLTLRELGVLMTAIMVAGRSGAAFAAQIGTMNLTEEIDAMRTIGVSPFEALVLPRILASIALLPLLGFYASIFGLIGAGFFCWSELGITPVIYVARLRDVVPLTDLFVGIFKAPVFGIIIAFSGCFHGMQVKADAEQVGLRTTAAVVQGIFLVIMLDAAFAVLFTSIGWI